LKKASWIILTAAASLTLLGGLASLSNAYFNGQERIGGVAIETLAAGNGEVVTAIRARRSTAASYACGFAVLILALTIGPYRRGDAWAWWAILAGTLTLTLLALARVAFLGTRSGAGTALVQLVVMGLGLALDVPKRGTMPVLVLLLAVLAPASARAETHHLVPTAGVPTFEVRPPILTV